MDRRDALKGLATIPVIGVYAYALYRKRRMADTGTFDFLSDFESRFPVPGSVPDVQKPAPRTFKKTAARIYRLWKPGFFHCTFFRFYTPLSD
jgi:hypothetical protein